MPPPPTCDTDDPVPIMIVFGTQVKAALAFTFWTTNNQIMHLPVYPG